MPQPTKEQILNAIEQTKKPQLTKARKLLGIANPNKFYALLRAWKASTASSL